MNEANPKVSAVEPRPVDILDLLVVVAENARLIVIGALAAGLIALGVAFIIAPTFTATTRILPPQQQQGGAAALLASQLGALAGLAGVGGLKSPAETYVALAKSRTVADAVITRFNLLAVYEAKYVEDARRQLAAATKITSGRDGLITIEVEDEQPKRAADLANAYVDELHKLTGSLAITEAQQRRAFFEKQLQQAQADLKTAEVALGQTGAGENVIKSTPQAVIESIARLKAQVTAQEIRISTMRGYLTESSPELQLARRELDSLRAQLAHVQRDQPGKSASGSDYLNRFRDFKYQETLFELMAKQFELARLDEAREGAVIQVVDVALVPERKSKPKRALIAVLATLIAGGGIIVFLCVRHSLRNVREQSDMSHKLARIRTGLMFWRLRKRA